MTTTTKENGIDALFRPAEEPAPCDHEWIRTMEDTPEWCRKCLVPKEEAERNTGFDSRSGATLPSSSGAGMANPVAGGRAPGQDALSSALAATPEPRYPCDRCGVLRTKAEGGTTFTVCDDCWDAPAAPPPTGEPVSEGAAWVPVLVEPRTPNTESVLIHHAHRGQACVACEVAALRAENEQLRRELEAKS